MEELPNLAALISRVESAHPASDPLGRLADAVETGTAVAALADHLVGHFVDAARAAGASWAQIGVALGVSKQAVQQRFVPREPATVADFDIDVRRYSRFTDRCVHCVVVAEKVARRTGADAVAPMHLLAGLWAEPEGLAIRAIADSGVEPVRIRVAVSAALPAAPGAGPDAGGFFDLNAAVRGVAEPGTIGESTPFTPEGRKIFDLAVRAALSLGHNYIGTEHLLLALIDDAGSEPARLLASFGITRDGVSASIGRLLAEFAAKSAPAGPAVSPLDPADAGAEAAEG